MRLPVRLVPVFVLFVWATSAQATFSIVARDSATGDIGVAVQSHYFSVGPIVPWAEPGIGAVATQSLVEVSYGPKGLEMMRNGKDAGQALKELLESARVLTDLKDFEGACGKEACSAEGRRDVLAPLD